MERKQFYKPLLWSGQRGTGDAEYRTFLPQEYDSGGTLMDHSWMGEPFVTAIILELENNPQHLVWVGEHSEGLEHDLVWGNPSCDAPVLADDELKIFRERPDEEWLCDGFVLNHTRSHYISLREILKDETLKDGDGWILNPVPILCVNFNGVDKDYVGDGVTKMALAGFWSGDLIEYRKELRTPEVEHYDKVNPRFKLFSEQSHNNLPF